MRCRTIRFIGFQQGMRLGLKHWPRPNRGKGEFRDVQLAMNHREVAQKHEDPAQGWVSLEGVSKIAVPVLQL